MRPRSRPAEMRKQLLAAKQPIHGRFRCDVHAFVSQLGHDLAWRMVPESLAREHVQHTPTLLRGERVPRSCFGPAAAVFLLPAPALHGARRGQAPRTPLPGVHPRPTASWISSRTRRRSSTPWRRPRPPQSFRFFSEYQKRRRFRERLLFAPQLTLELLDPLRLSRLTRCLPAS